MKRILIFYITKKPDVPHLSTMLDLYSIWLQFNDCIIKVWIFKDQLSNNVSLSRSWLNNLKTICINNLFSLSLYLIYLYILFIIIKLYVSFFYSRSDCLLTTLHLIFLFETTVGNILLFHYFFFSHKYSNYIKSYGKLKN